jgi:hypothetical protein
MLRFSEYQKSARHHVNPEILKITEENENFLRTLVSLNETSLLHFETPYTVHFKQPVFFTTHKPTKCTHNTHNSIAYNHSNMFRTTGPRGMYHQGSICTTKPDGEPTILQ